MNRKNEQYISIQEFPSKNVGHNLTVLLFTHEQIPNQSWLLGQINFDMWQVQLIQEWIKFFSNFQGEA
ncbi:hypothetical protein ACJX0J_029568, partial [Zea mays]